MGIFLSNKSIILDEGNYEKSSGIVTYSLGAMPDFIKPENKAKLVDDDSFGDCVVRLELSFDDSLDVSATPLFLCWTNITWAEEISVTITVEDNDDIDDQNPREREISAIAVLSIDELYANVILHDLSVIVNVFDDEYCDPEYCSRSSISETLQELEFDDEIQERSASEIEIIVVLSLFAIAICILIALQVRNRISRTSRDASFLEKNNYQILQQIKDAKNIQKLQESKNHEKISERKSLLNQRSASLLSSTVALTNCNDNKSDDSSLITSYSTYSSS